MKNRTSRIFSWGAIALFTIALLVLPAIDRKQVAKADSSIDEKTLTRRYDVVIVKGQFLSNFHGIPIDRLALLGFREGKLSPIPFQIDERDGEGRLIMTSGKSAGKDDDNGKLDANDELVFCVMDAGDRLPEMERSDKIEIEITDPRHPDRRAWVYLAYFKDGKVPHSVVDYVNYDPKTDRIVSPNYIMGYSRGFVFFDNLIYPASAGGNGQDFVDRMKVRINIIAIRDMVNIYLSEDDMSTEVLGWIDGPVRVMRHNNNYLKVFDYFPSLSFKSISEYYPYQHTLPINCRIPFNINTVISMLGVSRIAATGIADSPGLVGGYAYSNLHPEGYSFTGQTPPEVLKKNQSTGFFWGFQTKKGVGTVFPRFLFPDVVYQYGVFHWLDHESRSTPPDSTPGEIGAWWDLDFVNVPPTLIRQFTQDSFVLKFDCYFAPPDMKYEGAREWLDIRDYPVLVDVRAGSAVRNPPSQTRVIGNPPWEGGRDGTITDVRDRNISLKKLAYFMGGIEADARSYFLGERVTDATFHLRPLSDIRSLTNYYVDFDKNTKTENVMFSKVSMNDGSVLDLLGCKVCGWGGMDDSGRVVYYPNAQIKRIDFD